MYSKLPGFCNIIEINLLEFEKISFIKFIGSDKKQKRFHRINNIINDNSMLSTEISDDFLVCKVNLDSKRYIGSDDVSIKVLEYLKKLEIEHYKVRSSNLIDDELLKNSIINLCVDMYRDSGKIPSNLYVGRRAWSELFQFCVFGDTIKFGELEVDTRYDIDDNLIILSCEKNKVHHNNDNVEFGINLLLDTTNNMYFIFDIYPENSIRFIELV